MNEKKMATAISTPLTLPAINGRALCWQGLLLLAAVALPSAAHLIGAPVRVLLPMYWPVLLAGLVYGWRGGLLVGVCAPLASYFLSGHPLPHVLPAMTLELSALGFVSGFSRQVWRWHPSCCAAIAVAGCRLLFLITVALTGAVGPLGTYLPAAFVPGLPALAAMVLLFPNLAKRWVRAVQKQN